ncbi:MAG: HAMP domain-containing histidine kinase [Clostridiales bacterium]|nr:HAMP domain-containing histidine kinase [Clostridiales bacterium]
MNKEDQKKLTKKRKYRSQLTRRLIAQYVLTLIGFIAAYIIFVYLAWQITRTIIWQPYEPLYLLLQWVKNNIVYISGIIFLIGWSVITYYFMSKPLRYLDDIVLASGQLAASKNEPILLPAAMKNVQDELNLFREQALRSAMLAKEAEQRKNDLIVYLAHDLKTPLTSIIGYLSLLQDEPEITPELRAKYTGIALNKAERLEDLINEFFDITRFNLTSLTLEPERTNLSRMLEQLTNEFTPILSEKELCWQADIAPNIEILCDRNKLERVFDNLIRNAVNYSYSHSAISVSLKQTDDYVCIQIQNHGKTIPPEKLSRIFEQFFRVDSSRSSYTGGAGLGLAVSKEIVELHNGTIKAESSNETITFTVYLPTDLSENRKNL